MSVDKLKRVLWRLRSLKKGDKVSHEELKKAIMLECGTSYKTIVHNRENLKFLKWIKTKSRSVTITNRDLTE